MKKCTVPLSKDQIIEQAHKLGMADIGFTNAEAFSSQDEVLASRKESYEWTRETGMPLFEGTDPKSFLADAKSIILVVEPYFREAFPPSLVGKFGRAYQDDDRILR